MSELNTTLEEINNAYGEGTVYRADRIPPRDIIPTGVFMLDYALCGGVPEGLAVMLYGYESAGKSLLASALAANFQRKHPDQTVGWLDMEGTHDPVWAAALGVDLSRLYVAQPKNGQQGVDTMLAFMDTAECGLVVGDSIPSFVPKRVVDKSAEEDTMGELARLMGILSSKVTTSWADQRQRGHKVTVVLINQWRTKLGFVMGDPRTLPGGRQINHLATTKIELKKIKEDTGKDEFDMDTVLRTQHAFKLSKYKLPPSILQGEFTVNVAPDPEKHLAPGQVDNVPTIVTYAKKMGLITGGGSKWVIEPLGGKTFGKREQIEAHLRATNDDALTLTEEVLKLHRVHKGLAALPPDGYLVRPPQTTPTNLRRRSRK